MSQTMKHLVAITFLAVLLLLACRPPVTERVDSGPANAGTPAAASPLVIVVTDPLAIDNACTCIAGFAQRDYRSLSLFLKERFARPVEIVFGSGVAGCLKKSPTGSADIILGKDSVVRSELEKCNVAADRVAELTGPDGATTFHGLWVVLADDTAQNIADLASHRLFIGKPNANEKHSAAIAALRENGVTVPEKFDEFDTCREAVQAMLDEANGGNTMPIAACISDYALALLEGCESVPRGAIRVVGKTAAVPFIAAFVPQSVDDSLKREIVSALKDFGQSKTRCEEFETQGFIIVATDNKTEDAEKKNDAN
ncbi:MAG: PhnD/SsuA/transferrin family substrate-binding protein [Thermoguttaceae bacterium]